MSRVTCSSATGCSCSIWPGVPPSAKPAVSSASTAPPTTVWKRRIERHGLEILRPRERRRPRPSNQLSPLLEERIVAFALGHPGLGPQAHRRRARTRALGRPARLAQGCVGPASAATASTRAPSGSPSSPATPPSCRLTVQNCCWLANPLANSSNNPCKWTVSGRSPKTVYPSRNAGDALRTASLRP
jgi:hypothetical protein